MQKAARILVPNRTYCYYPGCTLHSTAREYDVSAQLVCQTLGIELQELEGWICCGASSAHLTSHLLGLALPAYNLKLAEETGLPLVIACAMCFSRMKFAIHDLEDKGQRELVCESVGQDFNNKVVVEPLLKVLDIDIPSSEVKRPLNGLKVACYYGCLLVRPHAITDFDDEENPQTMERVVGRLGATAIDWGLKTECCGASMPFARPDIVLRLSHRLLSSAKRAGADCLAVACPMCHSNLDMRQKEIESKYNEKLDLPILYFTQLMGLALGFSPRELLLHKHLTDPLPLLSSKGLI